MTQKLGVKKVGLLVSLCVCFTSSTNSTTAPAALVAPADRVAALASLRLESNENRMRHEARCTMHEEGMRAGGAWTCRGKERAGWELGASGLGLPGGTD
jgi:hypothetical protein